MLKRIKVLETLLLALCLAACGGGSGSGTGTPVPAIASFNASAAVVNSGATVTLSWSVSNASNVVLQPGNIDISGRSSYPVTPTATTTYTLQASSGAGSVEASTAVRVYSWSALGSTLDGFLSSSSNPPSGTVAGYSFLVFNRSGTLYTRSGGNQGLSTVEMLASASKLPSAAAILTLVDQGKLNLDTPIATYLSNAGNPITWPSDKALITMRMLLAHTSGLPGLNNNQPNCLNQPTSTTLQQCAQSIANASLVYQPGADFNYGGAGYQVAGYVATLIAGAASWQAFFNSAIAAPLGGISSFSYGAASSVTNPRIAGGAMSDVADYATFLGMVQDGGVFNGTQVLSASAISMLTSNQIGGLPVAYTPFSSSAAPDYPGYGLGVFISAASLYPGSPGPEFSDPGLYGSAPWFDNGLNYGAVLLINQDTQTGLDMWNAARPLIIQQLTGSAS